MSKTYWNLIYLNRATCKIRAESLGHEQHTDGQQSNIFQGFNSSNASNVTINTTKMIKGGFDLKFAFAKDNLCSFTISNARRKKNKTGLGRLLYNCAVSISSTIISVAYAKFRQIHSKVKIKGWTTSLTSSQLSMYNSHWQTKKQQYQLFVLLNYGLWKCLDFYLRINLLELWVKK